MEYLVSSLYDHIMGALIESGEGGQTEGVEVTASEGFAKLLMGRSFSAHPFKKLIRIIDDVNEGRALGRKKCSVFLKSTH